PGIPFYMSPKVMKHINPIDRAQYYAVEGRMGGGKNSFTDQHFVLGAYIWVMSLPPESRPPLKILYFNLDKTEKQKFQKLLCAYLWIYYGQLMDLNTLNGTNSKVFDINARVDALVDSAEGFFDGLDDVLDIRTGVYSPDAI